MQGSKTGTVLVEDFDTDTGKVVARHIGRNHVFEESFICSNWANILNARHAPTFFITDDTSPVKDGFQYLKGNIQLWGQVGQPASGRRGAFVPSGSFIGVDSSLVPDLATGVIKGDAPNKGRTWRYQYDFSASQLTGASLGCCGITPQYGICGQKPPVAYSVITNNVVSSLIPLRQSPVRTTETVLMKTAYGGVVRGGHVYFAYATREGRALVGRYDTANGSYSETDISDVLPNIVHSWGFSVGVEAGSEKMYILEIFSDRTELHVFGDDTFGSVFDTMFFQNLDGGEGRTCAWFNSFDNRDSFGTGFVVYGNTVYAYHRHGLATSRLDADRPWELDIESTECPYTADDEIDPFLLVDGKFVYVYGYPPLRKRAPSYGTRAFDIENGKQVAVLGNWSPLHIVHEIPAMDPYCAFPRVLRSFVAMDLGNFAPPGGERVLQMQSYTDAAMCGFTIPEQMRGTDGVGKRFIYQIEVKW